MENTNTETMALAWPDEARAIVVSDQESYNHAAKALASIAKTEKEVKAHHAPMKTTAHEAHRAAVAAEKKFLDPLNEAKKIIKSNIVQWTTAQAKIKLDEENRRRHEAEKIEEEERLARAIKAEKDGQSKTQVEKILETPKEIITKPVEPTFEKSSSVITKTTWKAEVTNIIDLCQAVVDGKATTDMISANMSVLNQMARQYKDELRIPGVKAVPDTNVAVRG